MTTKTVKQYVTLEAVRLANKRMLVRVHGASGHGPSMSISQSARAAMPDRDQLEAAGRRALAASRQRRQTIAA